jgi:WD40 repeat protein/predicted MPP superfamily phosphohydrolase
MTSGGGARSHELLDFTLERSRHEHFFGRDDALAELDRLVVKKPAGFVLVLGGPGMGKSALLSRWLDLRGEGGKTMPHHFIRRGDRGRDEPEIVRANLAAQIERLYPAQRDEGAPPDRRLDELLARVSEHVLAPEQKRLVVLVDGLDEAAARDGSDNPVARVLPFRLPKGVVFVCASRPTYPHLDWFEQSEQRVHPSLEFDQPAWSNSNDEAVRAFWAYHAASGRFTPPLAVDLVAAAVERARGNLLYSVKLAEWLDDAPVEVRTPKGLPIGLEGFLNALWRRLQALPAAEGDYVRQGLGLLGAAREALPAWCIEAALGWPAGTADVRLLGTVARQVLLEEPAEWHGSAQARYRLYHESFAELVRAKMAGELPVLHHRLAEQLAAWPTARAGDAFLRVYALRHGIPHRAEAARSADDWRTLGHVCLDVGYLRDVAVEVGPLDLATALQQAAERCPIESVNETLNELSRALVKESHWLRRDPSALPGVLYNRLLCRGWSAERLQGDATWPPGETFYRLRHPLQHPDQSTKLIPTWAPIFRCAVTPDGRRAISGLGPILRVWSLEEGRELSQLKGHESPIICCAITPDGKRAISGSADHVLQVWDLEEGRELSRLEGHSDRVTWCTFMPDGTRVVSASDDGTLRLWDVNGGRECLRLKGHEDKVTFCAVTSDGARVVSSSVDGTLRAWSLEDGRELSRLGGEGGPILCCAITPDGKRAVAGSNDHTLRAWDLESERLLWQSEGQDVWSTFCAVTPDGKQVIVVPSPSERVFRAWDLETGRERPFLLGDAACITFCAVTSDGRRLVSGSIDGNFRIWDLSEAGHESPHYAGHGGATMSCAITPDGTRAVSGSEDHTVRAWDVNSGREISRLEGHKGWVRGCAITADGKCVLSSSDDRTFCAWDLERGGAAVLRFDSPVPDPWHFTAWAFAPGRAHVVAGSFDGTIWVWGPQSALQPLRLQGHQGEVRCGVLLSDDRRLVSGSHDGTLRVWDLTSGCELLRLQGHDDAVQCCVVLPDGRRLASGSQDGTLRVWNLEDGRELSRFSGHENAVLCCAVSPDGRRLISGSHDRTLRVWDLEAGKHLTTIYGAHVFWSVAAGKGALFAGDTAGNVWFLTDQPLRRTPRTEPAIKPRPPTETTSLRFLHLTDWHVGMAEQGWLWPNVREAFFDDLERLHEQLGGFDAVFFTGDLTQRGSEAEFAKLDQGLAALWQRFAELGSNPVLVTVPGNHDLQRPPPKGALVKALGTWHADPDVRDALWSEAEGEYRQGVRNAFAPYAAWAERQPAMKRARPRWGLLPGDLSAVVERGGLRVGVVGLNSAFLQLTGADYDKKLDLDVQQLHAVCGGDAPAWLAQNDLNLLLTHHPPAWLEPARRKAHFETEIAPPGRFALHLHGHMHEPAAHAEAIGGSRPRHRLQGPSLFGLERFEGPGGAHEERIHGYAAGRIEPLTGESRPEGKAGARVRLWPRRLATKKSGARVMERDGEFELEGDESFGFEVPGQRRAGVRSSST